MKISNIVIKISEQDILQIIEEYVEVEGLKIEKVVIENIITIFGTYTKGIKVPFKIELGFGSVKNNIIMLKILSIKLSKIGLSVKIISYVTSKVVKILKKIGVIFEKDNVYVDIDLLSKIIPFVYFKINSIKTMNKFIEIEAENVIYAKNKENMTIDEINKEKSEESKIIKKVADAYTKLRKNIESKIPKKYKQFAEYIMILPDLIFLLGRLLKDDRVEIKTKAIIAATIAYLASPIQIIPDVIPVIGQVDEISLTFFTLDRIVNEVDEKIIRENWEGNDDIICKITEGTKFIFNAIGIGNTIKVLKFISSMKNKGN